VVRRVVGHDRLVGEQTYHQLGELYRALRLYVNCFQPSLKLLSKQQNENNRVRRVYDSAKTPLQRLLLSGVLSASAQHKLEEVAQALDPLDLAEQLDHLQNAVFRCAVPSDFWSSSTSSTSLLRFAVESCLSEPLPDAKAEPEPGAHTKSPREDANTLPPFLNWRRSRANPFASEGKYMLAWVRIHPECSTRDLFEELQQLFPGRYHVSQYPALQRVVRKLRAYLRHRTAEDPWPLEIIHGPLDASIFSAPITQEATLPDASVQVPSAPSSQISPKTSGEAPCLPSFFMIEPEGTASLETAIERGEQPAPQPSTSQNYACSTTPSSVCQKETLPISAPLITIERALQSFLEEMKAASRTDKTLEWHQRALHSFQYYLSQHHRSEPWQITTAEVHGWMAFLHRDVSATGSIRVANTINSYARSARAFCAWLVRQGYLTRTPFVKGTVPKAGHLTVRVVKPEEFERLLGACGFSNELMDYATARNRTLLWLFLETGLSVSEVCALRVMDVDQVQRQLTILGKGPKARRVTLGEQGMHQVLFYLDAYRLKAVGGTAGSEPSSSQTDISSSRRTPLRFSWSDSTNALGSASSMSVPLCCVIRLPCVICKPEEARASRGRCWAWTGGLPSHAISS
jgi:site-specific recombinase XerD